VRLKAILRTIFPPVPWWRYEVVAAIVVVYFFSVLVLYRTAGISAFALTVIPPAVAGALLGQTLGVLTGLAVTVVAGFLLIFLGYPLNSMILRAIPGSIAAVFLGFSFGRLYDLGQTSKREISERKLAEERATKLRLELEQAQKMEALGTLAGGIAHDMNNILSAIMTAGLLLERATEPDDSRNEDIRDILSAARRGRGLVRNLLGFAYKRRAIKEVISLDEVIGETVGILGRTLNKKIVIESKIAPGRYLIEADLSQIEQALINLCINAAAAMGDTGRLTLMLEPTDLTQEAADKSRYLEPNRLGPGKYYKIRVIDTGEGMDEETLEHIFEPFYTTRPRGKGTGLGLFMVYNAVKEWGGAIRVRSTKGAGTTVTIVIPARELDLASKEPISLRAGAVQGRGRILLVDDELLIRRTGSRLLTKLGYDVLLAPSGAAALTIYQREKESLSLVILDLIMPEMDGTETFDKIREINPEARILISSGYEKNEKVEDLLANGAVGFLQKPYEMEELTRCLRHADATRSPGVSPGIG
jgi:signal transduction histidine kinase/CheY-like chemotaxis protein